MREKRENQRAFKISGGEIHYLFVVSCLIPVVFGLWLPWHYSFFDDVWEGVQWRFLSLLGSGSITFLLLLLPLLALGWFKRLRVAYLFLLLPMSVFALAAQLVMFREFGTEINHRFLDLFQEDLGVMWCYGCREYAVHWIIISVCVLSFLIVRFLVLPASKKDWSSRIYFYVVPMLVVLFFLTPLLQRKAVTFNYFHSGKVQKVPLFQFSELFNFMRGHYESGYKQILARGGQVNHSDYDEIKSRLKMTPECFERRKVEHPGWLKRRPSHVFFFIMESFASGLIEEPALQALSPHLNQYAKEGILVKHFSAVRIETIDAIMASYSGTCGFSLYPSPQKYREFRLDTLPRLMERAGYQSLFLGASYRNFRLKGDLCEALGVGSFQGCPNVTDQYPVNDWGVNDSDFTDWAKEKCFHLKGPHFITFLNVSNHEPFDAPVEDLTDVPISQDTLSFFLGKDQRERERFAKHVAYADLHLGRLVAFLKERYPSALFVFMGDHQARKMVSHQYDSVPFILWNDAVINPGVDTSAWYGSQMDVLASLANLVLPDGETFRSLGKPVWDLSEGRVSVTSRYILQRGVAYTTRLDGRLKCVGPQNTTPLDYTSSESLRVGTAIEALSWGIQHAEPLK